MNSTLGNLTDSDDSFDRYQFVNEAPGVAIPILITLVLAALFGTFGNVLILITIFTTEKLHRLECIFMANLAISDMYVTTIADPLSIVGKNIYFIYRILFLSIYLKKHKIVYSYLIVRNFNCKSPPFQENLREKNSLISYQDFVR